MSCLKQDFVSRALPGSPPSYVSRLYIVNLTEKENVWSIIPCCGCRFGNDATHTVNGDGYRQRRGVPSKRQPKKSRGGVWEGLESFQASAQ